MLFGWGSYCWRVLVLEDICVAALVHLLIARSHDGLDGIDDAHACPAAHVRLVATDHGQVGAEDRVVRVDRPSILIEKELCAQQSKRAMGAG